VIDDPYETDELEAACVGDDVLWFGHSANLSSIAPYLGEVNTICSDWSKATVKWTLANEASALANCAVVLMTGNNSGASANRVGKALRGGRVVVAPEDCADSWRELAPYIHIGDVSEGI